MAANYYDWSVIAANNSNSDGDMTWAEGQAPSTVNNSARVVVQRVKQLLVDIGGSLAAGGTANGLTVTANAAFTAYADGMILSFRATASNTAAATLNVNGVGAKAIRKMDATGDVALGANDIRNTGIYVAQYSAALNGAAGAWLLVNPTTSTLTQPTLILKQSAAPAPTAEGDLQWDTDGNYFAIGDGAATRYPGRVTPPQIFSTPGAFVYTPTPGARFAVFEAVGGGGGSGGSDGQGGGTATATGGGGSAFYGRTGPIDITGAATFNGSIGAGGTAGAAAAGNGGNGGNTTMTVGATTYTWGGGNASTGNVAGGTVGGSDTGGAGGVGTNVTGGSQPGGPAIYTTDNFSGGTGAASNGTAGNGGSTPLGSGGLGGHWFSPTTGVAAVAGAGFGAGAGGSGVSQSTGNIAGAAGSGGYMRVWEYY